MKNDGGSAFPLHKTETEWSDSANGYVTKPYSEGGMSLRDYFAAKALCGLCADMPPHEFEQRADGIHGAAKLAYVAYIVADAMLAARAKD